MKKIFETKYFVEYNNGSTDSYSSYYERKEDAWDEKIRLTKMFLANDLVSHFRVTVTAC